MANTDATHLPADMFSTPGFILEVDQTQQFNAGVFRPARTASAAPTTTSKHRCRPGRRQLILRWSSATTRRPPRPDNNYLKYTGDDHVVLGGTAGDDIMIASIGDDTLWGDGGNDRLEGGYGNDIIEGGDGDDIITDSGGDDVLKGNEGNDVIHGGNGLNLIIGGTGNDFIITGEDVSEMFGGDGNDFILGAQMNLPTFGNEGDDWIEIGTQDGAARRQLRPVRRTAIIGHDVFIAGGGFDEADGEGGDDIFVGSDGEDHFDGGCGFDWASYKNDRFGVTADLNRQRLRSSRRCRPPNQGMLDRVRRGRRPVGLGVRRRPARQRRRCGRASTRRRRGTACSPRAIGLIDGLQELLGSRGRDHVRARGNIILGGGGSDIIEGRGGDDLIDGDQLAQRAHQRARGRRPRRRDPQRRQPRPS